tara:strand:- start:231 stop:581 length:351 start_codon:yes stop_codon:yes gene_type:complete
MITMDHALLQLRPGTRWVLKGNTYSGLNWLDESDKPTEEEINAKIQELEAAEPMRLLREERNRKLQETDWWVLPDRTASQEQINYRQSLRDLPSSASPELDENGQLSNVTWPTKPE